MQSAFSTDESGESGSSFRQLPCRRARWRSLPEKQHHSVACERPDAC